MCFFRTGANKTVNYTALCNIDATTIKLGLGRVKNYKLPRSELSVTMYKVLEIRAFFRYVTKFKDYGLPRS